MRRRQPSLRHPRIAADAEPRVALAGGKPRQGRSRHRFPACSAAFASIVPTSPRAHGASAHGRRHRPHRPDSPLRIANTTRIAIVPCSTKAIPTVLTSLTAIRYVLCRSVVATSSLPGAAAAEAPEPITPHRGSGANRMAKGVALPMSSLSRVEPFGTPTDQPTHQPTTPPSLLLHAPDRQPRAETPAPSTPPPTPPAAAVPPGEPQRVAGLGPSPLSRHYEPDKRPPSEVQYREIVEAFLGKCASDTYQ